MSPQKGKIISVNISENTGEKKQNVERCPFVVGHGLEGDAHARDWHRQVSLLAVESIDRMRLDGLDASPGDFAENVTTEGIELFSLPVGTLLKLGADVVVEITQIGKECHESCAIGRQMGYCVMPKEGVFAKVLEGGNAAVGDDIEVFPPTNEKKNRAAVVTVSDKGAAGEREDVSGVVVRDMLDAHGIEVARREIVPDDVSVLRDLLIELCDEGVDLIVTTGGTGLSPRDVTPEATLAVIEKEIPGMAEAMRSESLKVTPRAMISRAVCGLRGSTLIINLPGSPKGAEENLAVVMPAVPHALEVAGGRVSECGGAPSYAVRPV